MVRARATMRCVTRNRTIVMINDTAIPYFTGRCTGRSADFSPLRMRST
jgi:hypothetical protein